MKPENGIDLYTEYNIATMITNGLDSAPSCPRRNLPYCKPSINGNYHGRMAMRNELVLRNENEPTYHRDIRFQHYINQFPKLTKYGKTLRTLSEVVGAPSFKISLFASCIAAASDSF